MLPKFTCGKTILPPHFHTAFLSSRSMAKSGKTMLLACGKTMGKVTTAPAPPAAAVFFSLPDCLLEKPPMVLELSCKKEVRA
jgi:hypothetical protein